MRKFASAILLGTVLTVSGIAQTKTYEVRNGDTFDAIAQRFGVSHQDLVQANSVANSHRLQVGQKLTIPPPRPKAEPAVEQDEPGTYRVRNGDHDWAIAAKHGIKPGELHAMNPGVDWRRLQIGQAIRVPAPRSAAVKPIVAARSAPFGRLVSAKPPAPKWPFPTTAYRVKRGDNDWTIAHKFGIGLKKFQMLNPTLKSGKLKIGQYVRVPGTAGSVAASSNLIRSRYATISRDSVIVRRGASTQSSKITTVPAGTFVSVLDRQSGWYKLRFPRGTVGWVRGDMLKAAKTSSLIASSGSRNRSQYARTGRADRGKTSASFAFRDNGPGNGNLVENAMSLIGGVYRYGASSRGAMDCSGMVIQAAKGAGIKLPRTSRDMSRVGQTVGKGELKPGDLVFFRTRGSRISHVGIYKGNGQFIHASSSKGRVTVSNLNEGYYSRRYAGAKRVAGSTKSKTNVAQKSAPKADGKSDAKVAVAEKPAEKAAEKPAEKTVTRNTDEINP